MTIPTITLPRNAQLWLPGYLAYRLKRLFRRPHRGVIDILLCIADHYEPDFGRATDHVERRRVRAWSTGYPRLARQFADADGRPPQHTFFFPAEAYRSHHLDALADLCHAGFGEVEVHLHHGNDTSANLRRVLTTFRDTLASRHTLLSRDADGRTRYAFVHGNWALDNGRLDDAFCGVNDELTILNETGCYADLTMPSAPEPAQSRTVNSIYYAVDDPRRPKSYNGGIPMRVGRNRPSGGLPIVQGPFLLDWQRRVHGVLPGLENGALDYSVAHHPTVARFRRWVDAGIGVEGRPDWVVVKVYAHGAREENAEIMLGPMMQRFHRDLAQHFNDGRRYRLHYVSARELYNVIRAAEAGESGNPGRFRDYELLPMWRTRERASRTRTTGSQSGS